MRELSTPRDPCSIGTPGPTTTGSGTPHGCWVQGSGGVGLPGLGDSRSPLVRKQPDLVPVTGRAAEGRATRAGDGLYVEDLFHSVRELERRDGGAGADVDDPETALELLGVGRDRYPTEDDGLSHPRQPHEGKILVERESAGVSGKDRNVLAVSGGWVDPFQPPHAGVQDEQVPVVPAGGVRHSESGRDDLARGHVQNAATVVAGRAPSARGVGCRQDRHVRRGAVPHREAVQMTPVLGREGGDERRPPAWDEAVAAVEAGQAREEGVDHPQVRFAGVRGSPGDLVALDRARHGGAAGAPAAVVASGGGDRGGQARMVGQGPDLLLARDRDPIGRDGNPHGTVEPAERKGQLSLSHADSHELTGLVGRDQQRAPCLGKHVRQGGTVVEVHLGAGPVIPSPRRNAGSRRVPAVGPDVRRTHFNLRVYRRTRLLGVPPQGLKVNRARTLSLPTCLPCRWATRRACLSFLVPALVGVTVAVVVPASRRFCLDILISELPAGATRSLPAPATLTLTVTVALLKFLVPCLESVNAPPWLTSLTMTVPSSVPSVVHGSRPWMPSRAAKKTLPPRWAR